MATRTESMDWALWFYWIMATTLGWMVGSLFFSGIPLVVSGVAIAALQSVVLYRRIPRAWRWALLSSLGWIAGVILHVVLFFSTTGFLLGPLLGATVGVMQWLLLRKQFHWSAWWVFLSLLAWTTGLTMVPGLLSSGALPGALTGLALVVFSRFAARGPRMDGR